MKKAPLGVAVLIALGAGAAVSIWYYHHRRFQSCADELEVATHSRKAFAEFLDDPRPDGLYRRFGHQEGRALIEATAAWGTSAEQQAVIRGKVGTSANSALFLFGDMVYVLFFDEGDRLSDFVCLSN